MAYGQGTIRERRPGYWELRVMAPDPMTNRPRQISRGFRGGPKAARRALGQLVEEVGAGRAASTEGTVAFLLERWLDLVLPDLADNTVDRYRLSVRSWLVPTLGHLELRKLRASDLDALYARMRAAGCAPASIHKVHATIRRALNQARKWKWVAENVAVDASPPKLVRTEIRPPSSETLRSILDAADETDPPGSCGERGMFLRLAAASGARRGEVVGLRWSDLDASGGLGIQRAVITSGAVKDTKTHGVRHLQLDAHTIDLLTSYHDRLADRAEGMGESYGPDAYLFSSEPDGSRPWNPATPTHQFVRLCRRLGISGVRLHDLRHYHATELLDAGVPVATVSKRLGHARQSTTTDIYVHARDSRDLDAARIIGERLARP